jgi:thiol-disulfide isomerase/thioredoxin
MKKLFYILILILFWGSISAEQNNIKLVKGKVIIAGKVQNFNDSTRVLRFTNFSILQDIDQIAILDSLGNFKTELEVYNSQDVGLQYENTGITLYLHPGDSLYLNLDADQFKKEVYPYYEVSGKNSTTSKNICDYSVTHIPFLFDSDFKPKYHKPFNEFLSDIKMHLSAEDSVLQEFYNQNKPTNEFMNWERNYILYNSFSLFMNYFAINSKTHKEYETQIFNTGLFPRNDSAIGNSIYIWFLSQYPIMRYSAADSVDMQLLGKHDIKNAFARIFDELMKNEKPGLSRDIMIYKIFDNFSSEHGFPIKDGIALYDKYKPIIKEYIDNNLLISKLAEKMADLRRTQGKETITDLILKAKSKRISNFWEMLKNKNKNKIMYIDFWGTWCGPCRAELPYTVKLYNYYKNKPVSVVMICLYSNKNDWEKAIPKISKMSNNYFLNEDDSKILADELKVTGFPTHMIIDKKGELITKNIPSPADKEIKKLLNKMVEE